MRQVTGMIMLLIGLSGASYAGFAAPAPEIDPSAAVAAVSLIGGAALILRSRKRR